MPLHITPKRIADALCVGTPTVSRWLANKSQPRYKDHDLKLCELYGMTYDELFYETEIIPVIITRKTND